LKHGVTNGILWMYSSVPVPTTVPGTMDMQAYNMENQALDAIKQFSAEVLKKMNPDGSTLSTFSMEGDVEIVIKAIKRLAQPVSSAPVDDFSRSFKILSAELDDNNHIEKFLKVFIGLIKSTFQIPAASALDCNPCHELRVKLIEAVVNVFDEKADENFAHGTFGEEAKTPEHVSKVRRSLLETCSTLQFSALKFFAHLSVLTQGNLPPVSEIIRKSGFMDLIFGQSFMGAPECPYFFKHPSSQVQVDPTSLQCQYESLPLTNTLLISIF
jgi:hypothetical protein